MLKPYEIDDNLIKRGDRILIAFSGGPDSVYLALKLVELREALDLTLFAVHINHNLEEEADAQADFAKAFCVEHGITYAVFSEDIRGVANQNKCSLELAGRQVRYQRFYEQLEAWNCDTIALGHHKNDQAETLLYRMARGTGLHGMGGIKPRQGRLIRPLLSLTKEEILAALSHLCQHYNVDVSNARTDYVRNRIRHLVIPELEQVNEKAVHHMAELAQQVEEMLAYLTPQVEEACNRCIDQNKIDLSSLREYPVFLQKEVIRQGIITACEAEKDIGRVHMEQTLNLLSMQTGREVHLPYGVRAVREYDQIAFYKEGDVGRGQNGQEQKDLPIVPGKEYVLPGWNACIKIRLLEKGSAISEKIYTKYFSYDKIKSGITLRTAREGDYYIMNQAGQHKKLNRYFIDQKIPKEDRTRVPLLADDHHILWIVGGRISEAYKVKEDTQNILEITWIEKET